MTTILGVRTEDYQGIEVHGNNCDFHRVETKLTRYIIGLSEDGKIYELVLNYEFGECGSGWTTATWVHAHVRPVDTFKARSVYKISEFINFDCEEDAPEDFYCRSFRYSFDGGDSYYPGGFLDLNLDVELVALGVSEDKWTYGTSKDSTLLS